MNFYSGISFREPSETECLIVITSIIDERIPNTQFRVRVDLIISGWRITKAEKSIYIIYITQIDLNGHIPNAWLKYIEMILPQCAGTM
ncbi:hypothetical protein INT46_002502 [Mucor plumbeus]|uniref:START domain-containing protein n=1 Tax=Mucor plumbeus TaxID=97098 RepID=A0A8H7R436_9FUNG|nr:hypothetical protein INT46_002502 [Mucor plumbeus]